jgi:hypothetical protein
MVRKKKRLLSTLISAVLALMLVPTITLPAAASSVPVVTTNGGSSAFIAGDNVASTPAAVDSGITVTDADSATLGSATVNITGNFRSGEDVLSFSNSSIASYGNISATYNSASGVLTLASAGATATVSQWQAALSAVTYTDTAVTPNTATRTVSFTVTDDGGQTSNSATKIVTITDTDQTSIVTATGGNAYLAVPYTTPVAIDTGITVSDLDNTTLVSATVSVTGSFQSGDVLVFSNTSAVTYGNISASYTSGTGVLTLSSSGATATVAQWQNALRAVAFSTSATIPIGRTVSFAVSDGTKTSVAVTKSIELASVVSSVTPSGTTVPVGTTQLSITFNKAMDSAVTGTVTLADGTAASNAHWSADKETVTYDLGVLSYDTSYSVAISGFKDQSGNTMAPDSTHSFTTVQQPAVPAPPASTSSLYQTSSTVSDGSSIAVTVDRVQKTATASVSTSMGAAIASGSHLSFDMPSGTGVTSYNVSIPVAFLSTPGGSGTLTFNTDTGSVTLPADMLSGLSVQGSNATITLSAGDKSGLSDAAKAAVGNRPLISLAVTVDGNHVNWNTPAAPVTIAIPYTPSAAELQDHTSLITWFIDGSGTPVCIPKGHYNKSAGVEISEITHFSLYGVGYRPVSFSDVSMGIWYHDAVSFASSRGIATGMDNGAFGPDTTLTRGQFIVMLMRAYGIAPSSNATDNFTDAGNTYYTGYLAQAKALGIANGSGNNQFNPDGMISRQDMFTMLYRTLKSLGGLPDTVSGKSLSDFTDESNIADYARDAIAALLANGVISGSSHVMSPQNACTRAEMAQVLYNLFSA